MQLLPNSDIEAYAKDAIDSITYGTSMAYCNIIRTLGHVLLLLKTLKKQGMRQNTAFCSFHITNRKRHKSWSVKPK